MTWEMKGRLTSDEAAQDAVVTKTSLELFQLLLMNMPRAWLQLAWGANRRIPTNKYESLEKGTSNQ